MIEKQNTPKHTPAATPKRPHVFSKARDGGAEEKDAAKKHGYRSLNETNRKRLHKYDPDKLDTEDWGRYVDLLKVEYARNKKGHYKKVTDVLVYVLENKWVPALEKHKRTLVDRAIRHLESKLSSEQRKSRSGDDGLDYDSKFSSVDGCSLEAVDREWSRTNALVRDIDFVLLGREIHPSRKPLDIKFGQEMWLRRQAREKQLSETIRERWRMLENVDECTRLRWYMELCGIEEGRQLYGTWKTAYNMIHGTDSVSGAVQSAASAYTKADETIGRPNREITAFEREATAYADPYQDGETPEQTAECKFE
jgi:hypothetical protein